MVGNSSLDLDDPTVFADLQQQVNHRRKDLCTSDHKKSLDPKYGLLFYSQSMETILENFRKSLDDVLIFLVSSFLYSNVS